MKYDININNIAFFHLSLTISSCKIKSGIDFFKNNSVDPKAKVLKIIRIIGGFGGAKVLKIGGFGGTKVLKLIPIIGGFASI